MDVDLHYREQGTGEPLILLHGNGEDGSYFEHQMDAFASRFRVIALDTRGHGRSPRGEAPFTIRQFADDLLAFMDGQGIERAHLLGFSDGGNIALGLMVNDPNIAPEELAELRVPTLVVAGARDMIEEEHTRLIADGIPGARLVFVEGDHFVAAGNPKEFNQVVKGFLVEV